MRTSIRSPLSRVAVSFAVAAFLSGAGAGCKPPPPAEPVPVPAPKPCPEGMALMPAGRVVSRWFEPLWRSEWMKGRLQHLGNKTDDRPVAAFCIDLYEFPNEADALPRVSVSYDEAAALCRANGKRLCKEDEWERACAGNEGWDYAYGETKDPSRCNTESRVGEVKDLAPASKFPECKSPLGVYFLDGNVSEWVEATRDLTGAEQAIRGGTLWVADYGQSCYSRHTHDRDTRWNDDGFRCCADVAG